MGSRIVHAGLFAATVVLLAASSAVAGTTTTPTPTRTLLGTGTGYGPVKQIDVAGKAVNDAMVCGLLGYPAGGGPSNSGAHVPVKKDPSGDIGATYGRGAKSGIYAGRYDDRTSKGTVVYVCPESSSTDAQ